MEKAKHPVSIWLKSQGRKQSWLASELGLTAKALSENLHGHVTVMRRTKLAIQAITNNEVMADEWPK